MLISREIIFEVFQHDCRTSTLGQQTDRQTDRRTWHKTYTFLSLWPTPPGRRLTAYTTIAYYTPVWLTEKITSSMPSPLRISYSHGVQQLLPRIFVNIFLQIVQVRVFFFFFFLGGVIIGTLWVGVPATGTYVISMLKWTMQCSMDDILSERRLRLLGHMWCECMMDHQRMYLDKRCTGRFRDLREAQVVRSQTVNHLLI